MVTPAALPASRFRRRIVGLGVVATGALYVIGAPIFVDRVEADLDARVPTELADLGFTGITAEFSGQDGTLACTAPLDDPEGARLAAYDVRGVRRIELERSCRVSVGEPATLADLTTEPTEPTEDSDEAVGSTDRSSSDESQDASLAAQTTASTTASTTPTTEAALPTIAEIVAANPELGFLSLLLAEVDFPGADGPVTLFAPSNTAFDTEPAELTAMLQNDPAMLVTVLRHHAVSGIVTSADLVDGQLTALDGSTLVVATGPPPTVDGVELVDIDIAASDGLVHVVDRVLVPDAPGIPVPDETAATENASATYADGSIVLAGVLASEVERNVLVTSAVDGAGLGFVSDETTVDPDTGVDLSTTERLAALVRAMPTNLSRGELGVAGTEISATGVYLSEATRDAFVAAAAAVEVVAQLEPPPAATADDAVDLEAQLNAFVAENPILFEPGSTVLGETAVGVVERLARDAQQFAGVAITVEGHTDSDGDPAGNLRLSQGRAEAMRAALVERGVPGESIEAIGYGSDRAVLVDGVEDKGASRRVEFRVVTA